MASENIDFINRYNEWLLETMVKNDDSFQKGLLDWITEETVLLEPASIPWGGKMVGPEGWMQLRAHATAAGEASGSGNALPEFTGIGQWDVGGGIVLNEISVKMGPTSASPQAYESKIMEKYWIKNGRIVRIEEFYEDSAGVLKHLGWKLVAPK